MMTSVSQRPRPMVGRAGAALLLAYLISTSGCSREAPKEPAPPSPPPAAETPTAPDAPESAPDQRASLPDPPSSLSLEAARPPAVVLMLVEGLSHAHIEAATCRLYGGSQRSRFAQPQQQGSIALTEGSATAIERVLQGRDAPLDERSPNVLRAWAEAGYPTGFVSDREIFSTGLSLDATSATPWDRSFGLRLVMSGGWRSDDARQAPSIDDAWSRIEDAVGLDALTPTDPDEALDLPIAGLFAHGPFPPADTHGGDHPPFNAVVWMSAARLAAEADGAFFLLVETSGVAEASKAGDLDRVAAEVRELIFAMDGVRAILDQAGHPSTLLLMGHGDVGSLRYHACERESLQSDAVFVDPPEPGALPVWYLWSSSTVGVLPASFPLEHAAWVVLPPEAAPEETAAPDAPGGFCGEGDDDAEDCAEVVEAEAAPSGDAPESNGASTAEEPDDAQAP